jgi:hypothetical protein
MQNEVQGGGDGDAAAADNNDVDENNSSNVNFANVLKMLRNNEKQEFNLHDTQFNTREDRDAGRVRQRWTSFHVRDVADALMANTSIVSLNIALCCCRVLSIQLFLPFLRSCPRLEKLTVSYYPHVFNDNEEVQDRYQTQMSLILRAVLANPSIKTLMVGGSLGKIPDAIFDLLANTKTLKSFTCFSATIATTEMALAVAGGLARNNSLQEVDLGDTTGPFEIAAISGIGFASTIEALRVCYNRDDEGEGVSKELWLAMSKVLHLSPALKTLQVCDRTTSDDNGGSNGVDLVFSGLRNSACAGLKRLSLKNVCLGLTTVKHTDRVPVEHCNTTLQVLDLINTHFGTRNSVQRLWNLVGLKELDVRNPKFGMAYNAMDDEGYDCWKELIRRQKNISEVTIVVDANTWDSCAKGVVRGSCGHGSLETLRIKWNRNEVEDNNRVEELVGDQLRQVLAGNETLEQFILEYGNFTPEAAAQLEEGLFHNSHLQRLVLHCCNIPCHFMTMALEWLLTNQTLTTFDVENSTIEDEDAHSICRLLSRVFRCNKSLVNVLFPILSISAEDMDTFVNALVLNKTMVLVDFGPCDVDREAWNLLERSLVRDSPNKISISSIHPPASICVGDVLKSFLRKLPGMSGIQEVEISVGLDAEGNKLLLQAVKEKNTLLSFTTRDGSSDNVDTVRCPVEKEIDYYFKLNRFGRRILDCTNVQSSLWPMFLVRITSDPKDVDALYFFLREYFSNHRGGGNQEQPSSSSSSSSSVPQSAQRRHHGDGDPSPRPFKLARLN